MSNATVGAHVAAVLLTLLQCGLAIVLSYRVYLLPRIHKVDSKRRPKAVNTMRVLRICIFIMTALQCVRCIDPFALSIWPYALTRFIQLAVTITLYFQYSAITYLSMDTLYACALKRTPEWLAVVLAILPAIEFVVGFGTLIFEQVVGQQWVKAVPNLYVVVSLVVNLSTYNFSGVWLIRVLRKHQQTASSADVTTGSKSASPLDVMIAKTTRSMFLMTLPSLAAAVMYLIMGVGNCNNRPIPPYDPESLGWNVFVTVFVQLVLGLLFTRAAWISRAALDAEIMTKTTATISSGGVSREDQRRTGASRAELKERASVLSQSPSRPSESQAGCAPSVAVTVVDDSTECLPSPTVEIVSVACLPSPTVEIVSVA